MDNSSENSNKAPEQPADIARPSTSADNNFNVIKLRSSTKEFWSIQSFKAKTEERLKKMKLKDPRTDADYNKFVKIRIQNQGKSDARIENKEQNNYEEPKPTPNNNFHQSYDTFVRIRIQKK